MDFAAKVAKQSGIDTTKDSWIRAKSSEFRMASATYLPHFVKAIAWGLVASVCGSHDLVPGFTALYRSLINLTPQSMDEHIASWRQDGSLLLSDAEVVCAGIPPAEWPFKYELAQEQLRHMVPAAKGLYNLLVLGKDMEYDQLEMDIDEEDEAPLFDASSCRTEKKEAMSSAKPGNM